MRTNGATRRVRVLLVFVWSASTSLGLAQTYHLTDLGVINPPNSGQHTSHPAGINNAGQVTGNSFSGTEIHAARFRNGAIDDLGTIPGGSASIGVGINDQGDVVGDSQYSVNGGSIRHAALFRNGIVTDLGFLPGFGNYSRANGINNRNEVVGHSGPSLSTSNTRAFIWDASNGMRDLGTLGGQYGKAFSINDAGQVTGEAQGGSFGSSHAFLWDAVNGMRDLGTIAGASSSGAFINANGHVAGTSTINGFDNREHAFLYDGAGLRDLGAIGNNDFFSDRSTAYGINIHDHVVGSTYRPYAGGALYKIPFIYRNGQMLDLETLVDASGADYRLYVATGINDAGQIAVDAYRRSLGEYHAVLLTPNQQLVSAASRKTHGSAGTFDVNLPLTGSPGVECRSGDGGHTLVFTFANDLANGTANLTAGRASIVGSPAITGKVMTVNLANVDNAQMITLALNATDTFGQSMSPTSVTLAFLLGDSSGNNVVSATDVALLKASAGATLTSANFRCDCNVNGVINGTDLAMVKAASGTAAATRADPNAAFVARANK